MKEFPTDPYARNTHSEYFNLFNGKLARESIIVEQNDLMIHAVLQLVKSGDVIGQRTFLCPNGEITEDVIYRSATLYERNPKPVA